MAKIKVITCANTFKKNFNIKQLKKGVIFWYFFIFPYLTPNSLVYIQKIRSLAHLGLTQSQVEGPPHENKNAPIANTNTTFFISLIFNIVNAKIRLRI